MDRSPESKVAVQKSEWLVAAIFFLGAGAIAPWIVGLILQIMYFAGGNAVVSGALGGMIGVIASIAAINYSTIYISNYLKSRYSVTSVKKVRLIALGYFVVFMFPWSLYQMSAVAASNGVEGAQFLLTYHLIVLCVYAYTLFRSMDRNYTS